MASKIKISDSPAQPKATFLRKSAFLTTGDSSFKFNFNVPQDVKEPESTTVVENSGNSESNCLNDAPDKNKTPNKQNQNLEKLNFTSSGEFRFNFNIDSSWLTTLWIFYVI